MRVLLCVDMEGVSQIRAYREIWAAFPEYWETGRKATTADAAAAARGLIDGGAATVTICELHGPSPGPIVDPGLLPDGVSIVASADAFRQLADGGQYDALFLLGWHARCGTSDGFVSHTEGINLRVAVNGAAVTEAHLNAWRAGVPLLGVTGDTALGPQLNGVLDGVPFLPVKQSDSRAEAEPLYSPEQSDQAIAAFAAWCVEHAAERQPARLPERFVLTMSMPPEIADIVSGEHGLQRTSPAVVARSVTDWWYEAEPAIQAAMKASFRPWRAAAGDLEISSAESLQQRADCLDRFRSFLTGWATAREPEWMI